MIYSIRRAYTPLRRFVRFNLHRLKAFFNRRPVVCHHGIQRSGTNYLCAILENQGFFVVNKVDPYRGSPFHKHCRWQDDKDSILMDVRYRNSFYATSVCELNTIAGFPKDVKHVVLFKTPSNWLESINRWAAAHGWFDGVSGQEKERLVLSWLNEWDLYYSKWEELAQRSPRQVLILNYEAVYADPVAAATKIAKFMFTDPVTDLSVLEIVKVPHSKGYYGVPAKSGSLDFPFQGVLEASVKFNWQAYCHN